MLEVATIFISISFGCMACIILMSLMATTRNDNHSEFMLKLVWVLLAVQIVLGTSAILIKNDIVTIEQPVQQEEQGNQ